MERLKVEINMLRNKDIGIIGGSMAGLSAAILFGREGANVKVLERTSRELTGRGAGIVLPENFIGECVSLDLFDPDIPRIPITGRTFIVADKILPEGKPIWNQHLDCVALSWSDVYHNLRSRVPNESYVHNAEVKFVFNSGNKWHVLTTHGDRYQFDLLIAADGMDSFLRKQEFPTYTLNYAGYVAWRGTILVSESMQEKFSKGHMPCHVFENGHLLFYQIPQHHSQPEGYKLFNWLIYEMCDKELLDKFLVDKNGKKHNVSLPLNSLGKDHLQHLHQFASRVLPSHMAEIICNTKTPFLQVIFDGQVPRYVKNGICFIGDAATVLRPHSGSGVLKSIKDSISLKKLFENPESKNLSGLLEKWNLMQRELAQQQVELSKSFGRALVTHTPHWEEMDDFSMEKWWEGVMKGQNWYATNPHSKWKLEKNSENNTVENSAPEMQITAKL